MPITARFNVELMVADMTKKGWLLSDLAEAASVAPSTVGRFMSGAHQTAPMAKKLGEALGYDAERYFVSATSEAVAR